MVSNLLEMFCLFTPNAVFELIQAKHDSRPHKQRWMIFPSDCRFDVKQKHFPKILVFFMCKTFELQLTPLWVYVNVYIPFGAILFGLPSPDLPRDLGHFKMNWSISQSKCTFMRFIRHYIALIQTQAQMLRYKKGGYEQRYRKAQPEHRMERLRGKFSTFSYRGLSTQKCHAAVIYLYDWFSGMLPKWRVKCSLRVFLLLLLNNFSCVCVCLSLWASSLQYLPHQMCLLVTFYRSIWP